MRAKDSLGRYSNWTATRELIIDTGVPTCTITQAACTSGTLTLTLNASEKVGTPEGWTKVNDTTYTK